MSIYSPKRYSQSSFIQGHIQGQDLNLEHWFVLTSDWIGLRGEIF